MTTYYVMLALAIAVAVFATWRAARLTLDNVSLRYTNQRLETLLHHRSQHIDELKTIVAEWQEDEDEYRRNTDVHTYAQDVHQADEDPVRPQDQELHRAEPSPLY